MGQEVTRGGQPQPINIWLESLHSQAISAANEPEAVQEAKAQKDEAILLLLARLALVYWRPDFTPAHAKELYTQYLDDLREFAFTDISYAIEKYRRNSENKFYPTPGQIRGLIEAVPSWDVISKTQHMNERRAAAKTELQQISSDPRLQIGHQRAAE